MYSAATSLWRCAACIQSTIHLLARPVPIAGHWIGRAQQILMNTISVCPCMYWGLHMKGGGAHSGVSSALNFCSCYKAIFSNFAASVDLIYRPLCRCLSLSKALWTTCFLKIAHFLGDHWFSRTVDRHSELWHFWKCFCKLAAFCFVNWRMAEKGGNRSPTFHPPVLR